jgi:hypothetical protein
MTSINFLGGLLEGFGKTRERQKLMEEEKKERDARVKLFEIQLAREQRQQQQEIKQQEAQKQLFAKMRGGEVLPGTGVQLDDPTKKSMSLTDLLADPEGAMLALQGGLVRPESLMQGQQEPPQIQLLRALQADPELAKVDAARRAAGASTTTVNLDNQGLTKPPTGYFRPDPTQPGLKLEPGGPAQAEATEKARQQAGKAATTTAQIDAVQTTVNDALRMVGPLTSGFAAKPFASVPGTPQYDLAKQLETIRANLGFDKLAEMRANSPTGGALGSVAVKELEGLQASVANLDQFQSPARLKANIEKIQGHYNRWKKAVADAALPEGVPSGSQLIGTSNGNPVYQTPDGKKLVVEP